MGVAEDGTERHDGTRRSVDELDRRGKSHSRELVRRTPNLSPLIIDFRHEPPRPRGGFFWSVIGVNRFDGFGV